MPLDTMSPEFSLDSAEEILSPAKEKKNSGMLAVFRAAKQEITSAAKHAGAKAVLSAMMAAGAVLCVPQKAAGQNAYIAIGYDGDGIGYSVNNQAQAAGTNYVDAEALLFSTTALPLNLGNLGGSGQQIAFSINDSGQVVGKSVATSGFEHAFLYSNGVMSDLGKPSTCNSSTYTATALGINSNTQIVGDILCSVPHAFLYSNGTMTDLGTMGGSSAIATAINSNGQIVGSVTNTQGTVTQAFLYSGGVTTNLGTLGGSFSTAASINSSGQIVGYSYTASGATHAFLYSNGIMTDLGTLGGTTSYASSINDSGQIVGASQTPSGATDPFIYSNGSMADLNSLTIGSGNLSLVDAEGINNSGQIVVDGNATGTFLLVPVPLVSGKSLGSPCDRPGGCSAGNPFDVGSGNKYEEVTDYTTAGQNPLTFVRYYNSLQSLTAPNYSIIGGQWRTNYDRSLILTPFSDPTSIQAVRSDGQVLTFTLNGSTWTTDTDVDYTLTQTGSTWTLKDHNDTVEVYNSYGQLSTVTARNGYTQTLNYPAEGPLSSVTDSYNRTISFGYYPSTGELETVTTPDSLTLTYGYDTSDRLSTVSYNTVPVTSQTYVYENSTYQNALTGIIDENNNRYATWTYNSMGQGYTSQHGTGTSTDNLTTLTYNGNTTTVTNAFGAADTYTFTTLQGVPKVTQVSRAATSTTAAATETFTYDTNGYLYTKTDWNGNETMYTNDTHGDPTQINYAVGSPVAYSVGIQYDTPNFPQLPEVITAPGVTSTYNRDGNGNPLSRTDVDTTTTSVPYSTNGQSRETQWTWTSTGQELSVQLPRTDKTAKTQFGYTGGTLTSITDALGNETQITQYTPGGLPKTIIDPNNVTTTNTYDLRLNLHTSTLQTTAGNLITTWNHDAANELISVVQPDNSQLTNGYDTAHRLTSFADLLGNTTTYTLNALGGATLTNVTNSSNTVMRTSSAVFDALDRMTSYIGGEGQTTVIGYDPMTNITSITPPSPSGPMSQTFDALNRLSTHVDPAPGGTTTTTYNSFNFPLSVQDANGNNTSYVYDGFNDRIETASPDSGTSVFYFNPDRDLTKSVLPGSLTMNATFDADDRLLTRTYTGDTTLSVSNTWDQTTGHGFGVGHLTSATDQVGSLSLSYDERGNITNEVRTPTGLSALNTSTTFDAASNVSSITYPDGNLVTNIRDSMGKVTSVTSKPSGASSATTIVSGVTYKPLPEFAATGAPPVTGLTFGNGVTGAYAFDLDYRATTRLDAGSATVQKVSTTYYANDSVKKITDFVNAANTQTLNYNAVDELTSATSGTGGYGTLGFTWDPVGNIETQVVNGTITTYTLTAGTNRLSKFVTGSTTENVATSASGNITKFAISGTAQETLTYNKANELATAATAAQSSSYAFDEFGKRLKSVGTATGTSTFQYKGLAPGSNLLTDTDGEGNSRVDYIYLNGRPIGTYQVSNNKFYFISTDRLGTPNTATDSSQTVQWSATYQPFGNTSTGASGIVQNLRLPGQEWDLESTFNHNGFRDYATTLTRYIESDPIGLKGGMNTYQYGKSNPFKYTDRSGLDSADQLGQIEDEQDTDSISNVINIWINIFTGNTLDRSLLSQAGYSAFNDNGEFSQSVAIAYDLFQSNSVSNGAACSPPPLISYTPTSVGSQFLTNGSFSSYLTDGFYRPLPQTPSTSTFLLPLSRQTPKPQ